MAVDSELLEILACPVCRTGVEVVSLSDERRREIFERYRDKFRDEEPVVDTGLECGKCHRVYPVVSDIPVMLVDEALDSR